MKALNNVVRAGDQSGMAREVASCGSCSRDP